MWLMLSCCCRIGEVIQSRWEHVDLEAGVWVIPKENAKNRKSHTIFMSPVALKKFQELKEISTNEKWCFPDTTGNTRL
ncbi:tyrosine-type recombinase/integrase, partial [Candidatus Aalborgicola defluviihabitans]|uniref:tyrosine-type recombinase/integrase n=1 Tax=Candidatus Aalborgicola defluviihabitans TaxID=3386187 RepID=UPI001EC07793|nr:tyrosine-type recombinase/integrase [Burkholderiales bacterium]